VPNVSLSFGFNGPDSSGRCAGFSGSGPMAHLHFTPVPRVLGLLLGEPVFGVIKLTPKDRLLEVVSTLSLALVLFLDAVKLSIRELGKRWLVPSWFWCRGQSSSCPQARRPWGRCWDCHGLLPLLAARSLPPPTPLYSEIYYGTHARRETSPPPAPSCRVLNLQRSPTTTIPSGLSASTGLPLGVHLPRRDSPRADFWARSDGASGRWISHSYRK
jgi:hypothetical protein